MAVVLCEKPLKTLLNSETNSLDIHIATAGITWVHSKWCKLTFAHCEPRRRAARFVVSAFVLVTRLVTVVVQFNLGSNSYSCLRTMSRVCSEYFSLCLVHRTAAGCWNSVLIENVRNFTHGWMEPAFNSAVVTWAMKLFLIHWEGQRHKGFSVIFNSEKPIK